MEQIPVIDVSGLNAEDLAARRAVAAQLGQACREVGFFYVAGHGISGPVRRAMFDSARAFFALPLAEKERLSITLSPHNRGYAGIGSEKLDQAAAADQKEAFNIGLDLPPDHPEVLAGAAFRGVNLWPDLPGWRRAVLGYYDACQRLQLDLHRGIALDLGLAEDFFADKLDRPIATLRMLHYPAGAARAAGELGAGTHTDYGNLTILATDGVAGLQVRRRDGMWLDAPHIDGTFVCNIGDCLMRWTNDLYVSTPHRVLRPASERYSVAFFADPNPDALVAAIPTCVAPGAPPRYPPIRSAEYLRQRLDATYEHLTQGAPLI
jgi:isopenicillin N synthase-like dioxygenase